MWFLLLFPWVGVVEAQTTNATCPSNSTTSWLFSSNGDSPCLAWSKLQSLCLSLDSFINVPPLLDASWGYNLPGVGASECQCNSVAYSLMAGCTFCQTGQAGNWADEATFSSACQDYTSDGLPVGVDLAIPSYAWREWDGAHWNPGVASSSASSFSAFPTQTYSTTLSRSFAPSTTATTSPVALSGVTSTFSGSTSNSASSLATPTASFTTTSSSSAGSASTSASPNHAGPIIGGVVGGVVVLLLVFLLIFHLKRRESAEAAHGTGLLSSHSPESPRSSSRSFLDMLGSSTSLIGVPKAKKRQTELIADPRSFSAPRPAPTPLPPPSAIGDSMRYTTTSERMRNNGRGYDEDDNGQEILRKLPPVQGGLVVYDATSEDDKDAYESDDGYGSGGSDRGFDNSGDGHGKAFDETQEKKRASRAVPRGGTRNSNLASIVTLGQLHVPQRPAIDRTNFNNDVTDAQNTHHGASHQPRQLYPRASQRYSAGTDFSRSRPLSDAGGMMTMDDNGNRDTSVLPSLYEPAISAPRYTATSMSGLSASGYAYSAPVSPESRYPTVYAQGHRHYQGQEYESGYSQGYEPGQGEGQEQEYHRPLSVGPVGAALGSGKRARFSQRPSAHGDKRTQGRDTDRDRERERWEHESLPPLPLAPGGS